MKVALLPTPLEEGWESMNRYWWFYNEELRKRCQVACPLGEPVLGRPASGRMQRIWARNVRYRIALRSLPRCDVYHVLDHSYAELIGYLPRRARKVVTVHDLIPLQDEAMLTESQRQRFSSRVAHLRDADLVVSVSRYTAEEVKSRFEVPEEKIRVIPMGVDAKYFEGGKRPWRPPGIDPAKRIILLVGSALPRKNLSMLPAVLREMGEDANDYAVVKVGHALPDAIRGELHGLLGKGSVFEAGFVPEEDLPGLYAASWVLFFPSLLEGFGLPVLEAMASGCPVVCSDRASMPEVGGEAVLYFDPESAGDGAGALRRLGAEVGARDKFIEAGHQRARELTWSRHTDMVLQEYRGLVGGDSGEND